jgi:organic radical activating enzyme
LDNASADATAMESLAAMTGGQALAPEQLPELIERLARQTQHLEVQQETKKTFWDQWPFFLTLVGLLAMEWYLRKRWGLV